MTIHDIKQVDALNRASLPENYPFGFYLRLLSTEPHLQLIAENEAHKVVGYCVVATGMNLSTLFSIDEDMLDYSLIISIAVDTCVQKQGIGRLLLQECIKTHDKLMLQVRVTNKVAIHLYKQMGFCISKTTKGYYQDGTDAHVMTYVKKEDEKKNETMRTDQEDQPA